MIYKWWHRFVRKRTKPIPEETAVLWKRRLSIAYGLIAWNAFGLVVYNVYKGKADWAHYYGIKSDEEHSTPPGIKNAKVYRISGFKKVDEYDIIEGEAVFKDKDKIDSQDKETLKE
ncbi:hypothetical protein HF086_014082 [Spodoptera exigua]|uniref:Uncharacterized protein n=1 Tax=Spodoptera exigua TaxID=7107 RepID=A0A922MM59_SPOEX|nr:hypothetical protein HF086_014082 [Spodoptera exigua]